MKTLMIMIMLCACIGCSGSYEATIDESYEHKTLNCYDVNTNKLLFSYETKTIHDIRMGFGDNPDCMSLIACDQS